MSIYQYNFARACTRLCRFKSKTLNEKTGNCALILYKTNGKRAVLNAYYAPFPLST